MKQYFILSHYPFETINGEALKVRRLKRFGRIVLDEAINDGPHYWLVTVRGFREREDRELLIKHAGRSWGNGTKRFLSKDRAEEYFSQLAATPEYAAEEKKRQKLASQRRQALLSAIPTLRKGLEKTNQAIFGVQAAASVN